MVAELAGGMRVLDCFSNQGAFAVACAKAGASAVTAVEISGHQVKLIKENAQLNGVTITTVEENVFDYLSSQIRENAQFDLIILDPPSFTKSKESLNSARRGYKEIHLRALQLLSPNGYLATFSCSHHVSREMFLEMIVDASVDAKRHVRIVKLLSQPLDHPVLPHIPETEYLKGYASSGSARAMSNCQCQRMSALQSSSCSLSFSIPIIAVFRFRPFASRIKSNTIEERRIGMESTAFWATKSGCKPRRLRNSAFSRRQTTDFRCGGVCFPDNGV